MDLIFIVAFSLAILLIISFLFISDLSSKLKTKTWEYEHLSKYFDESLDRSLAYDTKRYTDEIESLKKSPTYDAKKVLAELASGTAILKIDVIDPGDIFLRSPK